MTTEAVTLRPAGLLERYHITRHELGFVSSLIIAANYLHADGTPLSKSMLYSSLRNLLQNHAALSVRIIGGSSKSPSFARLKRVDLSQVVVFSEAPVDNKELIANAMEEQSLHHFDTGTDMPLWRLVVFPNNFVFFVWHHAIADGLSALAFHRGLVAALNNSNVQSSTAEAEGDPIVSIPSSAVFVPPIEKGTDLTVSWKKLFSELWHLFAPESWTMPSSVWTGKVVGPPSREQIIRIVELTPQDAQILHQLCRRHKCTLTSVFHDLAVASISSVLTSDSATSVKGKFTHTSSLIPVSLRPYANTPDDVMCNHVSVYHSNPSLLSSTFSWDTSASLAKTLRTEAKTTRQQIGMLKYLFGNYNGYFQSKVGKRREAGLEVSNLGRFPKSNDVEGQQWRIGRTYFSQDPVTAGAAIKVNVVGNPEGGVGMTVTWSECAVDAAFGEALLVAFETSLNSLLEEGK